MAVLNSHVPVYQVARALRVETLRVGRLSDVLPRKATKLWNGLELLLLSSKGGGHMSSDCSLVLIGCWKAHTKQRTSSWLVHLNAGCLMGVDYRIWVYQCESAWKHGVCKTAVLTAS